MNQIFILTICVVFLNAQGDLGITNPTLHHTSSPSTNSSLALSTLLSSQAQSKSAVPIISTSSVSNTSVSSSTSSANPTTSVSVSTTATSTTNPPSSTTISITTTTIQPTSSAPQTTTLPPPTSIPVVTTSSESHVTSETQSQPIQTTQSQPPPPGSPTTTVIVTSSMGLTTATSATASASLSPSSVVADTSNAPIISTTNAIIVSIVACFAVLAAIGIYIFRKSVLATSMNFNRRLDSNKDGPGLTLVDIFKDGENMGSVGGCKSVESTNSDGLGGGHHQMYFTSADRFNVRYQDEPQYQIVRPVPNFGPGQETDQNPMIVQIPRQHEREMVYVTPRPLLHDQGQAYSQVYGSQEILPVRYEYQGERNVDWIEQDTSDGHRSSPPRIG